MRLVLVAWLSQLVVGTSGGGASGGGFYAHRRAQRGRERAEEGSARPPAGLCRRTLGGHHLPCGFAETMPPPPSALRSSALRSICGRHALSRTLLRRRTACAATVDRPASSGFSSSASPPPTGADGAATLLPADAAGIGAAARRLQGGGLVAFPTETVYGLGASALDEAAVREVFRVKGRPLTDPLIVHVGCLEDALALVEIPEGSLAHEGFVALANEFWPGGLTLVAPAKPHLPTCLSAGTGTVGLRVPSHPVALALLRASGLPVAAPSANRFGHVSPTTAAHVAADLGAADIAILDAEGGDEGRGLFDGETCRHGIESTVCKVDGAAAELVVYRRGATSEADLRRALAAAGLAGRLAVRVVNNHIPLPDAGEEGGGGGGDSTAQADAAERGEEREREQESEVGQEAPGQLITHYAPDVPAFVVRRGEHGQAPSPELVASVRGSIVLDFGGYLRELADVDGGQCVAYRDLSPSGDTQEAARNLFAALRWTETVEGAERVLMADLVAAAPETDEHAASVADRVFRAASGRVVAW